MVAQPQPLIREVVDSTDPAIVGGHDLLRRSFDKAELVGRREWRESLREREAGLWFDIRWHLIVAENGRAVVGVASGTYLGNVNIGLIGYVAVSPAARGCGVGPRLRAKLRSLFRRDAREIRRQPLQAVVGEVSRDNPWLKTLVRRDQVLALDFTYVQPSLHGDYHPVPLVLYYESLDRPRRRLPAALVRKLLYTTWRRVYRIPRPMAHPEFRRMLADLATRRFVGPLTTRDLPARARRGAHR